MWQVFPAQYYELQPALVIGNFSFAELSKYNIAVLQDHPVISKTKVEPRTSQTVEKPSNSMTKQDYVYFAAMAAYLLDKNQFLPQVKRILSSILNWKEIFELLRDGRIFGSFVSAVYRVPLSFSDSGRASMMQANWRRLLEVLKDDVRVPTAYLFGNNLLNDQTELVSTLLSLLQRIFALFKIDLTVAGSFVDSLFADADSRLVEDANAADNANFCEFDTEIEESLVQLGVSSLSAQEWKSLDNFEDLLVRCGFSEFRLPHQNARTAAEQLQNAACLAVFLAQKGMVVIKDCRSLLQMNSEEISDLVSLILQKCQAGSKSRHSVQITSAIESHSLNGRVGAEGLISFFRALQLDRIAPSTFFRDENAVLSSLRTGVIYVALGQLQELKDVVKFREESVSARRQLQLDPKRMACTRIQLGTQEYEPNELWEAAESSLQLSTKCRRAGFSFTDLSRADVQMHVRVIEMCFPRGIGQDLSEKQKTEATYYLVGGRPGFIGFVSEQYQCLELGSSGIDLDLLDL